MMTFQLCVEQLWNHWNDHPGLSYPEFWKKVLIIAKDWMEDQNCPLLSDLEKFELAFLKIINLWNKNYERWSIDTFQGLYEKTSRLLAGTYQTLFSQNLLETLKSCVDGCLSVDQLTPEDYSYGYKKETTSTSSTTVPGATEPADASGTKKR